jgi:hypothetical protein
MTRAERRRHKLGRAPIVVAVPNLDSKIRGRNPSIEQACNFITIDGGRPEDSKFVLKTMREYLEKRGNPAPCLDPTSPMLVARNKVTEEPLGFLNVKTIPPGKLYVENFIVAPGRQGKMAARALIEFLRGLSPQKKVFLVDADNPNMLAVVAHYGAKVVGYVLEGPFGATEAGAAAQVPENAIWPQQRALGAC